MEPLLKGQVPNGGPSDNSDTLVHTAGILVSLMRSFPPRSTAIDGNMTIPGYPFFGDTLPRSPYGGTMPCGNFQESAMHDNQVPMANKALHGMLGNFQSVATRGYGAAFGFNPQIAGVANGLSLPNTGMNGNMENTSPLVDGDHHYWMSAGAVSRDALVYGMQSAYPTNEGIFHTHNINNESNAATGAENLMVNGMAIFNNVESNDSKGEGESNGPDDKTEGTLVKGNKCHMCLKVYARPSTLKIHLRTHTGEKPFQCTLCRKSFAQDSNLTVHLRIHSGEKPFQCTVCHRRFAHSSSVTTHMRIHSGERPYHCRVCSRGFADRSTLTQHLRIHTGEKPYHCSICEMCFSQSGNLIRHLRVHKKK